MIKSIHFSLGVTLLLLGCSPKPHQKEIVHYEQDSSSSQIVNEPIISAQPTQVQRSNYSVDVIEANKMIVNDPNLLVLDVRTPREIPMDGKIANSVMIPLQVLGQYLSRIDRSKTILVYCHTGNRSLVAMDILHNNGFTVVNMAGGISSWKARGYPIVRE
jgi:rhodanese-related sulfurtransferase